MQLLIFQMSIFLYLINSSTVGGKKVVIVCDGEELEAKTVIKGKVKLYTVESNVDAVDHSIVDYTAATEVMKRFFISDQESLQEVISYNYKKKVHEYLPSAPELYKSFGKVGFRFENIDHMVRFYNKFRA